MSITIMANVWASSKQKGSELLMLLAIADFSDDHGRSWPSVETLANKTRLSKRSAQRLVQALERSGELDVARNQGRKGTNLYQVQIGGDHLAPPQSSETSHLTSHSFAKPNTYESGDVTPDTDANPDVAEVTPATPKGDTGDTQNHQEPSSESPGDYPEWFTVASSVATWAATFEQASNWRELSKISVDLAERKAYALVDWWPRQPKSRTKNGNAYATWQAWCREDRDKEGGGKNARDGKSRINNPPSDKSREDRAQRLANDRGRTVDGVEPNNL